MLQIAQFIATLNCTIFAGAAVYINLVEHPARMVCSKEIAATVWAPSYKRATLMQAPLALLSYIAGSASWFLGGGAMWLLGAGIILSVVPFTLFVIMPTNQQLLAPGRNLASSDPRFADSVGNTSCCAQRPQSCGIGNLLVAAGPCMSRRCSRQPAAVCEIKILFGGSQCTLSHSLPFATFR